MICTIYSHNIGFEKITDILKRHFPKAIVSISQQDEFHIALMEIKGGLFSAASKLKIAYRERKNPSYKIPENEDCPLTANLRGLYGFVSSLPASNTKIKDLFLQKIPTLNCEFSVLQEQGQTKDLKSLIHSISKDFDAILFVQPGTVISKSGGQHFLDKNLDLILDGQGNTEIDKLDVIINSVYFDGEQSEIKDDQKTRKEKNEKILEEKKIKVNKNLPCIESENEIVIRTAKEIAQRVCVLAMTNYVAFNTISGDEAKAYLKKYNLLDSATPNEIEFLNNPTEEKKMHETWKCEAIWLLMWALKKVSKLEFPREMCDLNDIPFEEYPVGANKDPNDFINSIKEIRSKPEILDACDLYYRIDWACVDARINNIEISGANPGVVYERHYALNWLINYMDQDWDNVSCDT